MAEAGAGLAEQQRARWEAGVDALFGAPSRWARVQVGNLTDKKQKDKKNKNAQKKSHSANRERGDVDVRSVSHISSSESSGGFHRGCSAAWGN